MSIVFKKIRVTRTVTQTHETWVQCDETTSQDNLLINVEYKAESSNEWDDPTRGDWDYEAVVLGDGYPSREDNVSDDLSTVPMRHIDPPAGYWIEAWGHKWITNGHIVLRDDAPRPSSHWGWVIADTDEAGMASAIGADHSLQFYWLSDNAHGVSTFQSGERFVELATRYHRICPPGSTLWQSATDPFGCVQVRRADGEAILYIMPMRR